MASCPCLFCSWRWKCNPNTALYITRANKNTWSISSVLGTLPNSSWRATAILALRSFFFCSGSAIAGVEPHYAVKREGGLEKTSIHWHTVAYANTDRANGRVETILPERDVFRKRPKAQGNISIHDHKRQRYRCKVCKRTFSARRGTMLEGLRKP